MDREQLDQLAAALTRYGQGSASALANGRDTIRKEMRNASEAMPSWANKGMELAIPMLPGAGALDSTRLGAEAGRHFREGRWGSGLETMGDAILAPVNDAFFFLPGGGFVKALPK